MAIDNAAEGAAHPGRTPAVAGPFLMRPSSQPIAVILIAGVAAFVAAVAAILHRDDLVITIVIMAAVLSVALRWVGRRKPPASKEPHPIPAKEPVWTTSINDDERWQPTSPLSHEPSPITEGQQIGEQQMPDLTITEPIDQSGSVPTDDTILPGPAGQLTITMRLGLEKIEGAGEDAQPLLIVGQSGSAWVGAFDGLGGAGKRRYPVKDTEWTGARIASYTARWAVRSWILRRGQYLTPAETSCILDELDTEVKQSLKMMNDRLPVSGPVITGSAIRAFPTTMAVGLIEAPEEHKARIRAIWAGDSRVYLLSPHQGLVALTTDHVRDNNPDSNRTSDSPMTNLLSASVPFYMEETMWQGQFPVITFAASDGCFEYFGSPMQFEAAILSTLEDADTPAGWSQAMTSLLAAVAGDDCTMSLVAVGWPTFEALKASFIRRYAYVRALAAELGEFADKIHQEQDQINALQAQIDGHRTEIEHIKTVRREREDAQWADYRRDYVIIAEGRKSH